MAGYNISTGIDFEEEQIYTWGYPGRGLLGREILNNNHAYPYPMKFIIDKFDYEELIKNGESKTALEYPTEVRKVVNGASNTVVLSETGVIFIYGSDDYGQSGYDSSLKEVYHKELNSRKNNIVKTLEFLSSPFQLTIPLANKIHIIDIAIGSHHIIALSKYSELFTWGRNDDGQLGLGFMTPKIETPTLVESMKKQRIKSVFATENYTACLSYFGQLFTCGSGEFGKLGNDVISDVQSEFELVELKYPVSKVALGIHHMAVI